MKIVYQKLNATTVELVFNCVTVRMPSFKFTQLGQGLITQTMYLCFCQLMFESGDGCRHRGQGLGCFPQLLPDCDAFQQIAT